MTVYENLNVYYGDLHNHCGISYGHGTLDDALYNATLQLDFCSVTGHALWPDMPPPDPAIDHIREFHIDGFAKLAENWPEVVDKVNAANKPGQFVSLIGFEMHSCCDGDYTVIYGGEDGSILNVSNFAELKQEIKALKRRNVPVMAFPHHIAYISGGRGINWNSFDNEISPIVELISMHGCSETDDSARSYLHSMGPCDYSNTVKAGLLAGKKFSFIGCTDHHSAFPGSYGHAKTVVWATELTRAGIWDALCAGRTYALTGDNIELKFALNGCPMGGQVVPAETGQFDIDVKAGGAIDYLDIIKNGKLFKRFSQLDMPNISMPKNGKIRTKIYLELGWGERNKKVPWDISLGIQKGEILNVEPRFRGLEVVSPLDKNSSCKSAYTPSSWGHLDERTVWLNTETWGNPNNSTNTSQGICLEVECNMDESLVAVINNKHVEIPLTRLLQGASSGRLGDIDSPAYCFHRAPLPEEYNWTVSYDTGPLVHGDFFYARIKQQNDQWAWGSPVFVG